MAPFEPGFDECQLMGDDDNDNDGTPLPLPMPGEGRREEKRREARGERRGILALIINNLNQPYYSSSSAHLLNS